MFENYHNACKYLFHLGNVPAPDYMRPGGGRPEIFIERTKHLLKEIGNPERDMRFVQVAGTSGKGSTCAMLQQILTQAGIKAGLFLSPFPTTLIENFRVGDRYIPPDELVKILEEIKPALERVYRNGKYGCPSYFETKFAIALLYFKKQRCKVAVLETGLGGTYDATNVVKNTDASLITSIGLDHMHILGNTLEKIAADKAGIIKPGVPFFTTETQPRLLMLFRKTCEKKHAPFHQIKDNGTSQSRNAALAAAAAGHLGIGKKEIRAGIRATRLPCRMEIMQRDPLVVLDGAHNPSKMKSVV